MPQELQDRSGALGAVARMLPKLPGGWKWQHARVGSNLSLPAEIL